QTWWKNISTLCTTWWKNITTLCQTWWKNLSNLCTTWWKAIKKLAVDWWEAIKKLAVDWWNAIKKLAYDWFKNIKTLAVDWYAKIKKVVDEWFAIAAFFATEALVFLVAFYNDPIGTLWAYLEQAWAFIEERIVEWLDENFASLDEMIDSIEPPDRGLPDVMAWAKGLREPETDEEKAYVAYLDEKLQHVLDDLLPDKPPAFVG
ncbi:unnamed protein product, partial [marine sediment metagenome]